MTDRIWRIFDPLGCAFFCLLVSYAQDTKKVLQFWESGANLLNKKMHIKKFFCKFQTFNQM